MSPKSFKLYRSFSELDLEEFKRIRKLQLNRDMTGQKFDSQALLATFAGHSLFSIFSGEIYLFQAMLHYVESMYSEQTKDGQNENESEFLRGLVLVLSQRQCVKQND